MSTANQAEGLLTRIAGGDRSAFNDCVQQHGRLVWGIVARFFANPHDREDVAQDVFLSLWKYANRYDPEQGSEATFVAVIARRRVVDLLRRRERDMSSTVAGDEAIDPVSAESTAAIVERRDEAGFILKAMDQLRDEEREVIRLAVLDGLTHAQVSERLDLPLGTVKSLARRGMIRLRELVQTSPQAGKEEL